MKNIKERLLDFIAYTGLNNKAFEEKCGLSNGFIRKTGENIRLESINKIKRAYPSFNINWLQSEEGEMLLSNNSENTVKTPIEAPLKDRIVSGNKSFTLSATNPKVMLITNEGPNTTNLDLIAPPMPAIPIYQSEFYSITNNNTIELLPARGYTSNPLYFGCDCIVINHSDAMSPKIPDGYMLGLKLIDKDRFLPQGHVYKLITSSFDFIRQLYKSDDDGYFSLKSPNNEYPEERINKNEIIALWHVKMWVPHGAPVYA